MNSTVIITGFPRSGTTAVCMALARGGLSVEGPWPHEPAWLAKYMEGDPYPWTPIAQVIKYPDAAIRMPPTGPTYTFVWCNRNLADVASSQVRMLGFSELDAKKLAKGLAGCQRDVMALVRAHPNSTFIELDFASLVSNPEAALAELAGHLPEFDVSEAATAIVQRDAGLSKYPLELAFMRSAGGGA